MENLSAMVEEGTFRRDLFYRLNAVTLEVPPLRKRRDEIGPLARLFLRRVCERWKWPEKRFDPALFEALQGYSWPGNIRQLRNVIERAVLVCSGDTLRSADLPAFVTAAEPAPGQAALSTLPPPPDQGESDLSFKERLARWESEVIAQALARTEGNVRAAARLLRMPNQTLVYKLKTYGLSGKDS